MSGGRQTHQVPDYSGLSIQTSSMVTCVPYVGGLVRVTPNLIFYTDYTVHGHKGGGKGASSKAKSYTYSATIILALGEGPCGTVTKTYINQGFYTGFVDAGFSFFSGATPQAPWSYLVSAHPNDAFGYQGICYMAAQNYNLGSSPTVPQTSFELQAPNYNTGYTGAGDADCALEIQRFLTNPEYGALFPSQFLDVTSFSGGSLLSGPNATTTGDSAYQTYCRAMGWGISPFINNQEQASSVISRWLQITNTAPVWTGYSLKFIPWGDAAVTGHGATYLPPTSSVFNFSDKDFIQDKDVDPVIVSLADWFDASNALVLEACDRTQNYATVPIDVIDQSQNELIGRRPSSSVQAHEICYLPMAFQVASLLEQRAVYIRENFVFKVGPENSRLEPMDCGVITDTSLGLVNYPVRIRGMDEQDDGSIQLTCEEFPGTLGQPNGQTTQGGTRYYNNNQVTAGAVNDPVIFEPNMLAAQRLNSGSSVPILCVLASGVSTAWGGALVNVSTDGGTTYADIGTISSAGRQGYLTANLASYGGTNPDAGHTLSVNLSESDGTLASASTVADAANGVTVGIVQDGLCSSSFEFISPESVTLTSAYHYDLTNLFRGQYGSAAGAHTTGALYGRLDDALFTFPLPAGYVGVALKIKLQSFNSFGNQLQDISTCTVYTYTPTGAGYGGGTGGVPTTPTGLAATGVAGGVSASWAANAVTDNVLTYTLWRAAGTGASFGSASAIWTGNAQAHVDAPLIVGSGYTYFLTANNAVGASGHTSGVNATPLAPAGGAPTVTATTTVTLTAGQFVTFTGSGLILADATDNTKPANGFVIANFASSTTATVYVSGAVNTALSGLTVGADYFLGTAGGVTTTVPATGGAGNQFIGRAVSATALPFAPGPDQLL